MRQLNAADLPHNTYHVELESYRGPLPLRAGGLHMRRLVRPGSIVRTNYGSGPYVVVSMSRDWFHWQGRHWEHWSLSSIG